MSERVHQIGPPPRLPHSVQEEDLTARIDRGMNGFAQHRRAARPDRRESLVMATRLLPISAAYTVCLAVEFAAIVFTSVTFRQPGRVFSTIQ
jgi:hypothetical protein